MIYAWCATAEKGRKGLIKACLKSRIRLPASLKLDYKGGQVAGISRFVATHASWAERLWLLPSPFSGFASASMRELFLLIIQWLSQGEDDMCCQQRVSNWLNPRIRACKAKKYTVQVLLTPQRLQTLKFIGGEGEMEGDGAVLADFDNRLIFSKHASCQPLIATHNLFSNLKPCALHIFP